MISIAPLAAEPCWHVMTPLMFGPNITGSVRHVSETYGAIGECSGAFSKGSLSSGNYTPDGLDGGPTGILNFAANSSSSVYSKSTTVQPPSIRFLPVIKF